MLLTRLHKLVWLNATLRILVVVGLLAPRVSWGECCCGANCSAKGVKAETPQPAEQPNAKAKSKKSPCCCSGSDAPCCCCQAEENNDPKDSTSRDQHNNPPPEAKPTDTPGHAPQPVPHNAPAEKSPTPLSLCIQCPDDCKCCQVQVRWANPVTPTTQAAEPSAADGIGPAPVIPILTTQQATVSPCPVFCPGADSLQPRLCRWQI